MRNRLIVLAAGLVFAASVVSVAFVAGRGAAPLEKLPVAASGAADAARQTAAASADEAASLIAPVAVEYRLAGPLPTLAARAPAYRMPSTVTAAQVAALARVLGLDGPVTDGPERLQVRSGDRELTVERQPGAPWYLSPVAHPCDDGAVGPDGPMAKCAVARSAGDGVDPVPPATKPAGAGGVAAGSAGTAAVSPVAPDAAVAPVPAPCPRDALCEEGFEFGPPPPRPADLPTRGQAEARARALLAALGTGVDDFELNGGFDAWYASVQPRVDGVRAGLWASVAIGPRGVVTTASGFLGAPVPMGDYPLVSTEVGFERMRAAGVGGGWFAYQDLASDAAAARGEPVPAPGSVTATATAAATASATATATAPAIATAPAPGTEPALDRPVPAGEPLVQTVTGARLALSFLGDRLVPVFQFLLAEGGWVEVPAVVDDLLEVPVPVA